MNGEIPRIVRITQLVKLLDVVPAAQLLTAYSDPEVRKKLNLDVLENSVAYGKIVAPDATIELPQEADSQAIVIVNCTKNLNMHAAIKFLNSYFGKTKEFENDFTTLIMPAYKAEDYTSIKEILSWYERRERLMLEGKLHQLTPKSLLVINKHKKVRSTVA